MPVRSLIPALLWRSAGFGTIWWAMTEGAAGTLGFGLLASAAAASASVALLPPPWPRPRLMALLRFVPFFLRQSIAGGADVVRRACAPRVPTAPALVAYPVAGMGATERVVFTLVVNLIPGTLSARLEDERLILHVIDRHLPVHAALQQLEERVAAVFGRAAGRGDGHTDRGTAGHADEETRPDGRMSP
ncbi:Na+/H+ antiporter subunit E [Verticiella sediminum]|uniref:Na+/H+ antiporter subunit E n=1 Tax=Verticiella sediminum TaxID=1247510 RepID=UPI001FE868B8|nr:Na+/H+ antiporter subunit E [Verticiella sediminum]